MKGAYIFEYLRQKEHNTKINISSQIRENKECYRNQKLHIYNLLGVCYVLILDSSVLNWLILTKTFQISMYAPSLFRGDTEAQRI